MSLVAPHIYPQQQRMVNHRRQVLARMGVEVWVSQSADIMPLETLQGDDVQAFDASLEIDSGLGEEARVGIEDSSGFEIADGQNGEHQAPVSPAYDQPFDTEFDTEPTIIQSDVTQDQEISASLINDESSTNKTPSLPSNLSQAKSTTVESKPATSEAPVQKGVSFEMVGASYRDWVLLLTADDLKQVKSAQLWQQIQQVLSLQVERLSFPICVGIDDLEAANASLRGFLFKFTHDDTANIALLGTLPEGVTHERLHIAPTLEEMLKDAQAKKSLWQILSS